MLCIYAMYVYYTGYVMMWYASTYVNYVCYVSMLKYDVLCYGMRKWYGVFVLSVCVLNVCVCYVCYVFLIVCMCVCYEFMYVCMCVYMYGVGMNVCMWVSIYVCMYV